MGSSAQLFSLQWNEFSASLASAVQVLRGHGDLVDVTLTAGGKSFPAHKIVLSAASPFLLEVLKETPCKHPVVMLAGVDPDDLESILEFVYHGQVNVDSSQLPSLLQAAHCLSIHGLSPPTLTITDDGEQVSIAAIPETTLIEEPELIKINQINNNQLGVNKKKKRRKSLSLTTTNKWPRIDDNCTNDDNEEILNIPKEQITEEVIDEDETSQRIDTSWAITQTTSDNSQQEQIIDLKQHLHNLLPLPQYSPLHIPSYPGSINIGMLQPATPVATTTLLSTSPTSSSSSLSLPIIQQSVSTSSLVINPITSPPLPPPSQLSSTSSPTSPATAAAAAAAAAKIRGASDCPGQCSFCGATLRQARNLRRHILSSCKFRFNNPINQQTMSDQMVVEIKPEIDISGFMGQSYMTDSGGSNSCDQIVYKTTTVTTTETPLSSPNESDINSQHHNGSSPSD